MNPTGRQGDSQIVSRQAVYRGRRIDVERLTVRAEGRTAVREVVRHPGAAVVLPLTGDGQVVLVRNERVAVGQDLLELPAGTLEPPEPPADCAARELAEETGYTAGRIEPVGEFFTSPGVLDERMFAFVATDLKPGPARPDDGERVVAVRVPYAEAVAMCLDGRIRDGKTIATLLLHRLRAGGGA